ncbi:MAG TPA: hypothetical protein VFO38_06360 [Candidatus Saccharimonadales bacterium]|nr:hypothetical protein [Candidatus Saccharimonadales bacterium]
MCRTTPTNAFQVFMVASTAFGPESLPAVEPTDDFPLTGQIEILYSPDLAASPPVTAAMRAAMTCMAITYWQEPAFVVTMRAAMMLRVLGQAYKQLFDAKLTHTNELEHALRRHSRCYNGARYPIGNVGDLGKSILTLTDHAMTLFDIPVSGGFEEYKLARRLEQSDTNSGRVDALEAILHTYRRYIGTIHAPLAVREAALQWVRQAAWPLLTGKELM